MDRRNHFYLISLLVIAVSLLMAGCENAPPLERTTARLPATLEGTFYSESPDNISFPVKVLFALDCSGSMGAAGEGSDPQNLRFNATLDFVDRYNDYPNVSFNIMLWNSTVFRQTMVGGQGGFTKDMDAINAVFEGVNNTSTTDYVGTIDSIYDNIRRDIMNTEDHDSLVRTKYIVIFFSDGLDNLPPTVTVPRTAEIIQGVQDLVEMTTESGVGGMNFHSFLLPGLTMPQADRADCEELMESMAYAGNGQFRVFETANTIDFINIVDLRLTVEYRIKFMVAYNLNVRPGIEVLYPDSDGDGLSDEQELNPVDTWWPATDPYLADTDGDGLSDFFELKVSTPGSMMDPLVADSPCQSVDGGFYPDTDMDGLNDCEEYVKGTNRFHPDTDHDGIPDHIEFLSNTNPLEAQTANDSDFDGAVDWFEVQTHTNVTANDPKVRDRFAYYYNLEDMGIDPQPQANGTISNVRRYDFTISNIAIMETLGSGAVVEETVDEPTGEIIQRSEPVLNPGDNLIRLFIAQVPEDMPDAQPIFRVCERVFNYSDSNRTHYFIPSDFQLLE